MDALRRWGAAVDVGAGSVQLDTGATICITVRLCQTLMTPRGIPSRGQKWRAVASVMIPGSMGVPVAQEEGPIGGILLLRDEKLDQ